MRQASFKIVRQENESSVFWSIYVPAYLNPSGRAGKMYFSTRAEAEQKRWDLLAATRSESKLQELSNVQVRDAQRALERLAEAGLADLSLDRAIELALPVLRSAGRDVSVECLLRDFAAAKEAVWSVASKRAFATSAKTFVRRWGDRLVSTIDAVELEDWFNAAFGSTGYRAHEVRTIRPAFSWAVRRRLIQESPFARMEGVRVRRKPVVIYSVEEVRRIMQAAPADCVAAFALLLFAGVRPKELTRLRWGDIRDGFIHITAAIAKTQQVRNIEVEPVLAAWLEVAGSHGPLVPVCPANWIRKRREVLKAAGVHALPDTARHSYASYHLALFKNEAALKANMGHAPNSDTLFIHYRAAATPADAQRFWQVLPCF